MFRAVMMFALLLATLVATPLAAQDQPLQVYILAGQSNMQGHAQVRTFPALALDPQTAHILEMMQDDHGSPIVCEHVWISALGAADGDEIEKCGQLTVGFGALAREPKIGPEFTFGIYAQRYVDQPILIIKTAWGGKSLHTDFRPPSAGPFKFHPSQLAALEQQGKDLDAVKAEKERETGRYYRLMIEHVKQVTADIKRVYPGYDPAQGYELAGFVWFQGWNDMVDSGVYPQRSQPGGYDQY
ncbi:MAG TPA: sialate O-acetylesterase, partial [Pirellulaceae bacterium]|nr:sialate O-acetylesterase [Pirellulaceae bacterium]